MVSSSGTGSSVIALKTSSSRRPLSWDGRMGWGWLVLFMLKAALVPPEALLRKEGMRSKLVDGQNSLKASSCEVKREGEVRKSRVGTGERGLLSSDRS